MALTAQVKEELARVVVEKPSCRKAEIATMLRFAGGLHIVSGRIVIEAELDTAAGARRLRLFLSEVYGHSSEIIVVSGGALKKGNRYVVRVVKDGESLARQTGLLDHRGRPVRGLPPAGRRGIDRGHRRRLARSVPRSRVADRTRALVRARGDIAGPGGRPRPRGRRASPRHRREVP